MITFDFRKNIICTTGALVAALAFTAAAAGPAQAGTARKPAVSIADSGRSASAGKVELADASVCDGQQFRDRHTPRRTGGRVIDGPLSEARA